MRNIFIRGFVLLACAKGYCSAKQDFFSKFYPSHVSFSLEKNKSYKKKSCVLSLNLPDVLLEKIGKLSQKQKEQYNENLDDHDTPDYPQKVFMKEYKKPEKVPSLDFTSLRK